jgi:hypothetical protein
MATAPASLLAKIGAIAAAQSGRVVVDRGSKPIPAFSEASTESFAKPHDRKKQMQLR